MQILGDQRRILLDLARRTIRAKLTQQDSPFREFAALEGVFQEPAGCFVSLHAIGSHQLRGCVGQVEARDPLWRAVHDTAGSVLRDPRFADNTVTHAELVSLEIEVTVLSPLVPANDPLDFDPMEHGIYLIVGARRGCFLPQVARETGWPREKLLERLCTEKLELEAGAWKTPIARLFTFRAEIIGPEPFVS